MTQAEKATASPSKFSIDESGMARLEKLSFDAYNKSDVLIGAIERYRKRTGHYPERALADKIYRNRENLAFCKLHGIRLLNIPMRRSRLSGQA